MITQQLQSIVHSAGVVLSAHSAECGRIAQPWHRHEASAVDPLPSAQFHGSLHADVITTQQLQTTSFATAQAWFSSLTLQAVGTILEPRTGVERLQSMPFTVRSWPNAL